MVRQLVERIRQKDQRAMSLFYQMYVEELSSVCYRYVSSKDDAKDEKPWQWSFNASAGAEYAITPLLGLYLEPSLGYYFHDGTSFEHYYKEHPLAPSIEFGLRLHILNK